MLLNRDTKPSKTPNVETHCRGVASRRRLELGIKRTTFKSSGSYELHGCRGCGEGTGWLDCGGMVKRKRTRCFFVFNIVIYFFPVVVFLFFAGRWLGWGLLKKRGVSLLGRTLVSLWKHSVWKILDGLFYSFREGGDGFGVMVKITIVAVFLKEISLGCFSVSRLKWMGMLKKQLFVQFVCPQRRVVFLLWK